MVSYEGTAKFNNKRRVKFRSAYKPHRYRIFIPLATLSESFDKRPWRTGFGPRLDGSMVLT